MHFSKFQARLAELLKAAPEVEHVEIVPELITDGRRYLTFIAVTVAGRSSRWQITWRSPDNSHRDNPPPPAVHGDPPAYTVAPATASPDAWLGGVIGAAALTDVERIEVWSPRKGNRPGHIGVTTYFRNGERAFVRMVHDGEPAFTRPAWRQGAGQSGTRTTTREEEPCALTTTIRA